MTPRQAELLLLSAHELELEPLRRRLQDAALPVPTAVVGVGMAAAGGGTARALAQRSPGRVVLVGSCGAYPGSELPLLSLVAARSTRLVDAVSLEGRAALPSALARVHDCDAGLLAELRAAVPGMRDGVVATTPGVTVDDALARAIADRSGCSAENLEALSVGLACAAQAIPFAALLCVTNQVGSQGRVQWTEHHARAAELTADAVLSWLRSPRPHQAS